MSTYAHINDELEPYRQEGDGLIWFQCDHCEVLLETEEESFYHAWNLMHRKGWRSAFVKDEWLHLCEDCVGDGESHRKKKGK